MDPLFQFQKYVERLSNHVDMHVQVRQEYDRPLREPNETGLIKPGGTQPGVDLGDNRFFLEICFLCILRPVLDHEGNAHALCVEPEFFYRTLRFESFFDAPQTPAAIATSATTNTTRVFMFNSSEAKQSKSFRGNHFEFTKAKSGSRGRRTQKVTVRQFAEIVNSSWFYAILAYICQIDILLHAMF